MPVVLDERRLAARYLTIQSVIQPLFGRGGVTMQRGRWPLGNSLLMAVYTIKRGPSYRDVWFELERDGFEGQYFEQWIESPGNRQWSLSKAYLSLFKNSTEFLCLHCDPLEQSTGNGGNSFKAGPHLHIKAADEPIPHAHIALYHSWLSKVLKSDQTLFSVFQDAIIMIREEILSRV